MNIRFQRLISVFSPRKRKTLTTNEARAAFLKYKEHPFRTHLGNYFQRVKLKDGYGFFLLNPEEIKKRLDSGACWLDYPVLNEDGSEINGMTEKDLT